MGHSYWSLIAFVTILLLPICNGNSYTEATRSTTVVMGSVTCDGCSQQRLDKRLALSGASVAINCQTEKGVATRGAGSIDENGSFKVELPSSVLNDRGELAQPCFAKLVSGNTKLCSFEDTQHSNLAFKSKEGKKSVLTTSDDLSFSTSMCNALLEATQGKFSKFPPLPKLHPKPEFVKPKPFKRLPPKPKFLKPKPFPKPKLPPLPKPMFLKPKPKPPPVFLKPRPSNNPKVFKPTPFPKPKLAPLPLPKFLKPKPKLLPPFPKPKPFSKPKLPPLPKPKFFKPKPKLPPPFPKPKPFTKPKLPPFPFLKRKDTSTFETHIDSHSFTINNNEAKPLNSPPPLSRGTILPPIVNLPPPILTLPPLPSIPLIPPIFSLPPLASIPLTPSIPQPPV